MTFYDFLTYLGTVTGTIAALWAGGNVLVSLGAKWQKINEENTDTSKKLAEIKHIQKNQWERIDELQQIVDARLDQQEQKIQYMAGMMRVNLPNLPPESGHWTIGKKD